MSTQDQIVILPKNFGQGHKTKEFNQVKDNQEEENSSAIDIEHLDFKMRTSEKKLDIVSIFSKKNTIILLFIIFIMLASITIFFIASAEPPIKRKISQPFQKQPEIKQKTEKKDNLKEGENPKQISPSERERQRQIQNKLLPIKQQIKPKQIPQPIIQKPVPIQKPTTKVSQDIQIKTEATKYVPVLIPIATQATIIDSNNHDPTRQHKEHPQITFPYPTLGMPQTGKPFNKSLISEGLQYYKYEAIMDQLFKPYNNTNCQYQRFGDKYDGGYLLCKNMANKSQALINVGVGGIDLFGCDVANQFKIPNFQYDCTNSKVPICYKNSSYNYFQQLCIGQRAQPNYYSLKNIVDSRNLTKRHVIMKIDVEGAEWPGFRSFPIEYLDYVDQFALQIHLESIQPDYKYPLYWGNVDTLKSIGDKFVSVNMHMNNYACDRRWNLQYRNRFYPSYAIEITLVNKKLITIYENTRSYKVHPLNEVNKYGGSDCQFPE